MDFVIGQLTGFLLGLLAAYLYEPSRRSLVRLREQLSERRSGPSPLRFDPASLDFVPLNRWSVSRPLERARLRTHLVDESPRQDWFDPELLESYRRDIPDDGGLAATLVDLEIDHHESARGRDFAMHLAPAVYADHVAVSTLIREHPEALASLRQRFATEEARNLVRSAPPSVVSANVTVQSDDSRLLAVQRSRSVRLFQGQWTLGPNETMNFDADARPGDAENLLTLVERALAEEVGLATDEFSVPFISWIGYNLALASVHVVAHARARLPRSEIEDRIGRCHAVYEVEAVDWVPMDRRDLANLIASWRGDPRGRVWLPQAPLAAQEVWRVRSADALRCV